MRRLAKCADIEAEVIAALDAVPENRRSGEWDKPTEEAVKHLKAQVMAQGMVIQAERCAWCTLFVGRRGRRSAERDHIAPKGKHPRWTFLPLNLVISCEYCNGFSVKSAIDTVKTINAEYELCAFHVVHPYLDDPDEHIRFGVADDGSGVVVSGISEKGRWTVSNLKLDDPGLTMLRAREQASIRQLASLPDDKQRLLLAATGHDPTATVAVPAP